MYSLLTSDLDVLTYWGIWRRFSYSLSYNVTHLYYFYWSCVAFSHSYTWCVLLVFYDILRIWFITFWEDIPIIIMFPCVLWKSTTISPMFYWKIHCLPLTWSVLLVIHHASKKGMYDEKGEYIICNFPFAWILLPFLHSLSYRKRTRPIFINLNINTNPLKYLLHLNSYMCENKSYDKNYHVQTH